MSAISKETQFDFDGVVYNCKSNFAFLNRVEQRLNLVLYSRLAESGTSRVSDIAWIIYSAVSLKGYAGSYEAVGDVVMQDFKKHAEIAGTLIAACFPPSKAEVAADTEKK